MNAVTVGILGFTAAGAAFAGGVLCCAPAWLQKIKRAKNDRIKARRKVGMKGSEKLTKTRKAQLTRFTRGRPGCFARPRGPRARRLYSRFNGNDGDRFWLQGESKLATLDLGAEGLGRHGIGRGEGIDAVHFCQRQ